MVGAFFFFSWGYSFSYCLCNTQSCFSSWVYRLTFASLYPCISFVVGIYTVFRFSIPTLFASSGYSYYFLLLHTQSFSLPWVFTLLFVSPYPNFFISLGIYTVFCFSIPTSFAFSGYSFDLYLRYTQSYSLLWV